MKRFGLGFLFALVALAPATTPAQGRFGLGAIVGEPTGFSLKYWLDGRNSIDGIIGVNMGRRGGLALVGDWAHHWADLTPVSRGRFLLGLGAGMFIGVGHDLGVGVRVKGLADYMFAPAPVNIFLEIAPTIEITDPGIGAQAGLGVRWFF